MDAAYARSVRLPASPQSKNTTVTRTPALSAANRCRKRPPASDSIAPQTHSAAPGHEAKSDPAGSWLRSFLWRVISIFRPEPQVVHEQPDQSAYHCHVSEPLQWPLPQLHHQRNGRIARQPAVKFWLCRVMKHVNHARASDPLRIVNTGVREIVVVLQLLRSLLRQHQHVFFASKVQTTCRTRLDARGLQPFADAVRTQRALVNALRLFIELRNIERASADAISATDALVLLKIHNPVRVLDNRPVRWARSQTTRLRAVHALIFSHQPHQRAIFLLVLIEQNQVPIIPPRLRHRLIRVVKRRRRKRHVVPLDACYFARLAADASRRVHQLRTCVLPRRVLAPKASGVARYFLHAQCRLAHRSNLRHFHKEPFALPRE